MDKNPNDIEIFDEIFQSLYNFISTLDIVQNVCLINMGTADIYGSVDPFQRMPKSPRPGDGTSPSDFITRIDLSNYSGITPDKSSSDQANANEKDKLIPTQKDIARVKSPNPALKKAGGSSAEESSFSKSLSSSVNRDKYFPRKSKLFRNRLENFEVFPNF